MADITEMQTAEEQARRINIEQLRKAQSTLEKYRNGKANLDNKLIAAEDWFKLNHYSDFKHIHYKRNAETGKIEIDTDNPRMLKQSAWMFNSILNKHADIMDNYPDPVIMARSADDEDAADTLSSIVPVVLDNCNFEQTYSDNNWDKLAFGTAVYAVTWNSDLQNGLGDIEISPVDMLSIYWEPGVKKLQDSQNIFVLSLVDKNILEDNYPQCEGKLIGSVLNDKQYHYDDSVDVTDKAVVIDWYYKTRANGRTILNYVKWVDDIVLYSSEDDEMHPEYATMGFYNHGMYPFVMDTLYREKGTPAGFGFVDVMRSPQTDIDNLSADLLQNAKHGAKPRYFSRDENGINESEFMDVDNHQVVHVAGSLDDNHIKVIDHKPLDGAYLNLYQQKIDELKETSGNRDFSQGSTAAGVTSGSAIAALQEAGSKGSRDMIKGCYRSFSEVCKLVIELMRQFYDTPRTFRITGGDGGQQFVEFDNSAMQGGINRIAEQEFQTKEPVFDIIVKAQKANPYSRLAQNELALQFYNLGFFNPELTDQALACIEMMDFDGKEKVQSRIAQNGTMADRLAQMQQTAMQLAELVATQLGDARPLQALQMTMGGEQPVPVGDIAVGQIQTDSLGNPMTGNTQADKMRRRMNSASEVQS